MELIKRLTVISLIVVGALFWFNAAPAQSANVDVRIVSNPGLENETLNQLIKDKGYLEEFGVNAEIIEAKGPSGPVKTLMAGKADICLVSGYNGIIPTIEKGAKIKIVGGAAALPAHAIYTYRADIKTVNDLVGKSFGIGPNNGLLHALSVALLRKSGVDPKQVNFQNKGSNANVYKAVVAHQVDAGLSSISHLKSQKKDSVHVVEGSKLWEVLPEYTFQTAYASDTAIAEKREALIHTLAAYSKLYRFLQSPESKSDFFKARKAVDKKFNERSAESLWKYIQDYKPYNVDLVISKEKIDYLQNLNMSLGTQTKILSYDKITDMSLAEEAKKLK